MELETCTSTGTHIDLERDGPVGLGSGIEELREDRAAPGVFILGSRDGAEAAASAAGGRGASGRPASGRASLGDMLVVYEYGMRFSLLHGGKCATR